MQRTILLLAFSVVIVAVNAPLLLCVHAVFLPKVRWLPEPTLARGWRTPEEAVQQTLASGINAGWQVTNPTILFSYLVERDYVLLYVGQPQGAAASPPIGLSSAKWGWRGWHLAGQRNFESTLFRRWPISTGFGHGGFTDWFDCANGKCWVRLCNTDVPGSNPWSVRLGSW